MPSSLAITPPAERRRIYGRRQSHRIRPARKRLLAERLPILRLDLPAAGAMIEPAALFDPPRTKVWLEIGFGGGEHLAALADAHPDVGLIGCEPYINGVARLLSLIQDATNIRVVVDDARLLLKALPDRCLDRIFVLFPDPWPKARHQKRRIVNHRTVADMTRLLLPGGELRLATDDQGYARAMLGAVLAGGGLTWLAEGPADWRQRPADWPATRYERKAIEAGRRPMFFRFLRTSSDDQP